MLEKFLIEGMFTNLYIKYERRIGKGKEEFIRYNITDKNSYSYCYTHYYIDVYMNGKIKVVYATDFKTTDIKNFCIPREAFYDFDGNIYDEPHLFDTVIKMVYCKCMVVGVHGIYHVNNGKKGNFSNFYIK